MEGITVLNEEILKYYSPLLIFVIVLAGIIVLCVVCCGLGYIEDDHKVVLGSFVIAVVCGALIYAIPTSPNFSWKYTKYEVILDDTVSYKQLEEKFDIGETRGDIIVLYEKDYDKPPNKR